MKLTKKILGIIFSGIFVFLFLVSCGFNLQILNTDDYVQFIIREINFEKGDWDFYQNAGYDTIKLTNFWDSSFQRTIKFNYDESNFPYIPIFDNTVSHTYKNNKSSISMSSFNTYFSNNYDSRHFPNELYDYPLRNGYINYLSFSYSPSGISIVDLSGDIIYIDGQKIFSIDDPDKKFDADVEVIKRANLTNDFSRTVNFVVMADGYTNRDIGAFETYTRNAFKDAASFHFTEELYSHYSITNKFFDRFWDNYINVIMVKTISNDSGVDTVAGVNRKDTILDVNVDTENFQHLVVGSNDRIKKVMDRNFEKIGLHPSHVDVIIILVNQRGVGAYVVSEGMEMGDRNIQPINRTIISAPAGYAIFQSDFHRNVRTSAIAHELGHALARLADEYEIGHERTYDPRKRNIDLVENIKNPKWQGLMNANRAFFTDSVPWQDTDHRVGNFIGAYYSSSKYIRPTYESTMRGQGLSKDYQFGPVNTYHLTGSFYTRIGKIEPQDPGYKEMGAYEWRGYSFYDFSREWQVSDFYY